MILTWPPSNEHEAHNLQDSTQITSIEFKGTKAIILGEQGWPVCMPQLKALKVDCMLGPPPPQQLVTNSNLRHLDSICHVMTHRLVVLPTCCSELTQLDSLRLSVPCGFPDFPVCLLQLRQLSVVDLAYISVHHNVLPVEILQFSEFTAFTVLDMRPALGFHWSLQAREQLIRWKSLMDPGVLRCQCSGSEPHNH